MGLVTKSVKISPRGKMIKYYHNKGYNFKCGEDVEININDLSETSRALVNCSCDYCGQPVTMEYQYYIKFLNTPTHKVCCPDCRSKKRAESTMLTYGVSNIMMLPEKQEKSRNTLYKNFGVTNPVYSEEICRRIQDTCYKKYNTSSPLQNPDVINKIKDTVNRKYGCDNVFQNEKIKKEIRKTRYNNQSIATSNQQLYLSQLLGGTLNYIVCRYSCDIVFTDEKLILEYDGGGHWLSVKLGEKTQEQFDKEQIVRDNQIKRDGYKVIRIISRKDYLPSDTVLLQMLQYARDFFAQNPDRSWISFDIDNSCIYNAYYKESSSGLPYDYGKLRKIKKEHLSSHSSQTLLQPSAQ